MLMDNKVRKYPIIQVSFAFFFWPYNKFWIPTLLQLKQLRASQPAYFLLMQWKIIYKMYPGFALIDNYGI